MDDRKACLGRCDSTFRYDHDSTVSDDAGRSASERRRRETPRLSGRRVEILDDRIPGGGYERRLSRTERALGGRLARREQKARAPSRRKPCSTAGNPAGRTAARRAVELRPVREAPRKCNRGFEIS